ncbi:hypothetical protein H5410_012627 [Solanum commersonii]|uniref:Uncharacterized protein n=1 Tax=Solanum commersonii TaxID=4109 RepID=A0A9J6ASX1_SOLCO|nr:hypothetical protein H5410_012627 [Solanum commersonii]
MLLCRLSSFSHAQALWSPSHIPSSSPVVIRWLRFGYSDKLKLNWNLAKRNGQLIISHLFNLSLKYGG